MPKVVFQVIAFNAAPFLEPCLKAIAPYGEIVAAEGPVNFWCKLGFEHSTDDTREVLAKYTGHLICGTWPEKNEMVQAASAMLPADTTHVFCVDSDEIWPPEALEKILAIVDEWDSMAFRPYSFYGGFERYMTGYEENCDPWGWQRVQRWYSGAQWKTHRPPTVLAEDGQPMRAHRHLSHEKTDAMGIRFFHYSYVLPKQMANKANYYRFRNPAATVDRYMDAIYLPWVRGDDKAKARIERKYRGVHNERGHVCYTRPFTGQHPAVIQEIMPALQVQFAEELEAFR